MKTKLFILAFLNLLLCKVYSQEFREKPLSYSKNINFENLIEISIPDPGPIPDNSKKNSQKMEGMGDKKIGVGVTTNIQFKHNATIVSSDTSGTLFILKISSTGAEGLALVIDNFNIPQYAKLFVYGNSKQNYKGPYVKHKVENIPVKFNVGPFYENSIIIEYFEPYNPEFTGDFFIPHVAVIKKKEL